MKELNKIHVIDKKLHENKQKKIVDFAGEFEMVGSPKVSDQIRQILIRFRNIIDYEAYISAIDVGYDAEDAIFTGYFYKINTIQFNLVNRNQYGNGWDFKLEIIENQGNNCYIPTKGFCFVKCKNFITGEDYKQQYLDFIKNEKSRINIMTKARIQPFRRANNIKLGYFDGTGVLPRSVTDRDIALLLHNNHFSLIWKSEGVSFNQSIKELKDNFKKVDSFLTEENFNSHCKYEFIPKKLITFE